MSDVLLVLEEHHARRLLVGLIMNDKRVLPDDLRLASDHLTEKLTSALKLLDSNADG